MGIGALLVFIAVAMLARFVVRPVTRVLGWPLEKIAGTTGRLARENAMRNPARTARTAAALMIGLGLIVFVAVFTQGLKDGFRATVVGSLRGNVVAQSSTFLPMPAGVTKVIAADKDMAVVSPLIATVRASSGAGRTRSSRSTRRRSARSGSSPGSRAPMPRTRRWAETGVVVDTDVAKSEHLQVGEPGHARDASGKTRRRTSYGAPTTPTTRRSPGSS